MLRPIHVGSCVKRAANGVTSVLLAPYCAACQSPLSAPLDGPVCRACWSSVRELLPPLCRICGDPLPSWRIVSVELGTCPRCRRRASALDASAAAGEYEGTLRAILHAFKYDGRQTLATPLGALLQRCGSRLLDGADFTVPVPLHRWRRLKRGFNQATSLARQLELPVVEALYRVRATQPQAGLSAAARRRNVTAAICARKRTLAALGPTSVEHPIVVLVDDVRTTGATLEACARALKAAGAREVRAVTVARAAIRERP